MSRKTMIALAKAVALTSGLTVDAFAHGRGGEHGGGFGGRGHMGGCGGARIDSGFVSGFAGLHFGTALGLALFGLVLASSPAKPPTTTSRAAKPACTTR